MKKTITNSEALKKTKIYKIKNSGDKYSGKDTHTLPTTHTSNLKI